MKTIDRYLLSEMVSPFLFGLSIFGSLWMANLLIKMVNLFVTKGVSLMAVVEIFLYSTPAIVVTTLPMATLLAGLLSLGRMNSDSEIIAMKACGIGFGRIVIPLLFIGIGISFVAVAFNEYVVPEANTRRQRVFINEVVLKKPLPKVAKDIFFDGGDEFRLFVRNYNPAEEIMMDISMFQFQRDGFPVITEARRAKIEDDVWTFDNGRIIVLDDKSGQLREEIYFEQWRYPIKTRHADRVNKVNQSDKELGIGDLYKRIKELEKKGLPAKKQWAALYFKTAFPFASFFLLLIGAPFAIGNARSGASIGVGLSILIMFVYYILIAVGKALGEGGKIPPFIGAWLPNIVAGVVGIFLLRRAMKT